MPEVIKDGRLAGHIYVECDIELLLLLKLRSL